jgi:D-alanyl-D-alanine carboxypeptidase
MPPLCWPLLVAGLLAIITVSEPSWDGGKALAASPHAASHDSHPVRKASDKRTVHGPGYHPPYSAIVIDDNSGEVLYDEHADEPRHPASITKIMTLYLLFEQLEAGTLKLDTPLRVSAFASLQPPTKLGFKSDQTVTVEDAIKALVTESANDVAVVISEAVGGSEAEFAKLMTKKAKALGMMSTTYVNSSAQRKSRRIFLGARKSDSNNLRKRQSAATDCPEKKSCALCWTGTLMHR